MIQGERTAQQEWKAHWPLVISAMIGFSFFTMVTYSLGTFMEPLQKAFGWNRAQISSGLTIFSLISTIGGPFIGAVLDRIGTRRIALFGMIVSGLAFAAFSLVNGSLTQWYLLWTIFGICALAIKSTVWSAGTSSVFTASRGLALAAVLSGSALGQIFAPIISNALIQSQGWQGAYRWIGFGWAGFAALLVLLFFFDAHDFGKRVSAAAKAAGGQLPGLTLHAACRDSRIIRMALANLLMSFVGSGVTVHLVPLITETGITRGQAVEIAAWAGIGGIIGKFLSGWLLDRIQGSLVPFTSFAVAALGHFLLLNMLHSPWALIAGTAFLGYSSGAGLQVSTYLISRYAGLRNFGTIFGTISSSMMLGTALGPLIAGHIHDVTGGYAALLWAAIPVMLVCSFLFVGLGPYPRFEAPEKEDAFTGQPAPAE